MQVNDQVEVSIDFDRYSDDEVSRITTAFSYIARNTKVDVILVAGNMKIKGDTRAVAEVFDKVKHYFT